ncbi:MAG: hypothetical protein WCS37_09300, partial [Chloroflexota bacterium]
RQLILPYPDLEEWPRFVGCCANWLPSVDLTLQFLKDLQEIIKLTDFDIIVATHSPDIIGNRWDLTVALKGPDE